MGIGQKLERLSVTEDLFPELSSAEKAANKLLAKIANKIFSRRKQLGMTQKQLSARLNVSQPMISQWESGECNFSVENLVGIFEALDLSVDLVFNPIGPSYSEISWNMNNSGVRSDDYWEQESEAA